MTRLPRLPLAALLLPGLLSAGCTAPVARALLRSDLAAVRAGHSRPAPSPFGEDVPGVVHAHTRLSHDSPGPLEELVAAARETGVRWVCITDHSNPETARSLPRGEVGGVLLVPGEEVTIWSSSMLALGTAAHVERRGKTFAELEAAIRAGGGVPLLAHVTHFKRLPRRAPAGMAVYDLSGDYREISLLRFPAVLSCLSSGDPEASAEAFLLFVQGRQEERRALWDRFLAVAPCAGVAETNAHAKFRYLGRTFDPYAGLLGLVRNHALLPALDEAAVLEAVERGRLHIGFDALADTSGARFEALRGERPVATGGDALPFGPSLSLAVHLPLPARVRVLRDGLPWREGEGRVLHFPVEGPGVYRAEAEVVAGGEARPWVLFNPVRVLPAGGP